MRGRPFSVKAGRTMQRLAASKEPPMNKPERLASAVAAAEFQAGGVIMRRPFRIRRLGHFGVNVADPEKRDRKSTRLNSSHLVISYAVFCLKKKIDILPELSIDRREIHLQVISPFQQFCVY